MESRTVKLSSINKSNVTRIIIDINSKEHDLSGYSNLRCIEYKCRSIPKITGINHVKHVIIKRVVRNIVNIIKADYYTIIPELLHCDFIKNAIGIKIIGKPTFNLQSNLSLDQMSKKYTESKIILEQANLSGFTRLVILELKWIKITTNLLRDISKLTSLKALRIKSSVCFIKRNWNKLILPNLLILMINPNGNIGFRDVGFLQNFSKLRAAYLELDDSCRNVHLIKSLPLKYLGIWIVNPIELPESIEMLHLGGCCDVKSSFIKNLVNLKMIKYDTENRHYVDMKISDKIIQVQDDFVYDIIIDNYKKNKINDDNIDDDDDNINNDSDDTDNEEECNYDIYENEQMQWTKTFNKIVDDILFGHSTLIK